MTFDLASFALGVVSLLTVIVLVVFGYQLGTNDRHD